MSNWIYFKHINMVEANIYIVITLPKIPASPQKKKANLIRYFKSTRKEVELE